MMGTARRHAGAVIAAACLVVSCGDGDLFGPRLLAGIWLSAWPRPDDVPSVADTLILDGHGGGRINWQVVRPPVTPGGPPRWEWQAGTVRYRLDRGAVYLRPCIPASDTDGGCDTAAWPLLGHVRDDGMLYIGPSSLASSMAPLPWRRASR